MLTGLYLPGHSVLHRAGAGPKLVGLLLFSTLLLTFRSPLAVAVGTVVTLLALVIARVPPRVGLAQVWPLRWFVLVLVPYQWWVGGWQSAVSIVGTMVVAVAAASVVTLTTRVSEMMDALVRGLRPLRRFGVDPQRPALVLSLTIRAIPVVAGLLAETREARRARGLERSTRALVTPVVVRTIRHADRVGEALAARGVDD